MCHSNLETLTIFRGHFGRRRYPCLGNFLQIHTGYPFLGIFLGIHTHFLFKIWLPIWNKAVLEPRVSPAFAITYFWNHYNIRFDPMHTCLCVRIYPMTIMSKSTPMVIHQDVDTVPIFQKNKTEQKKTKTKTKKQKQNLTKRSMTPRWPLPHLCWGHICVTLPKDHCIQVP